MNATSAAEQQPDLRIGDVVFAEATERQRILSWELNGASWAAPLSLEEYVGRETTLSQTPLSADGGTKYLVLFRKDNPDIIVSACEVTTKEALIADADGCRTARAYGIASVFTAPPYRGLGMASHLLKHVKHNVDKTDECDFGALYSDIGRSYYTRLGWNDFTSLQAVFHLEKSYEPRNTTSTPVEVIDLTENDVKELCDRDTDALKQRFERLAADAKASKDTYVTFLPTFKQCSWHFTRESYVAKVLNGTEKIKHRGAKTQDGSSWILWDHDLREPKLKIMRIVTNESDSPEKKRTDIGALVEAALAEASLWNLPKVGLWAPGEEISAAATKIWLDEAERGGSALRLVFESREEDSVPSLRWNGGEEVGKIIWEDNEYFAWC